MKKKSKRYILISKLIDKNKFYLIDDALELVKKTALLKFIETINIVFHLNINLKDQNQILRGFINLPSGTGKNPRILVLTTSKQKEAIENNADFVGAQDIINKIQTGWLNFDILIATPEIIDELNKISKILGPKKLMPTIKSGTLTTDVQKAIIDIRKGKIEYQVNKFGNIHLILGKTSFSQQDLKANYLAIINILKKNKPITIKGNYIKNIFISSVMGPSIKIFNKE